MWLLNTHSRKLWQFLKDVPDYVILSHRWGDREVQFEDIAKPDAERMLGYEKIRRCCEQAADDGFDWVWIDTCCIDKRNSAELIEAINSMYNWYWQAKICYAYLVDVSAISELVKSKWFSRGWTLQELLAPPVVEFYDSTWGLIGTRSSLVTQLEEVTRIERHHLLDRSTIRDASIGTKFSWASRRETSREEDIAYCLLGLCNVHMPLLYGEGMRAFYRLQLEIIKDNVDHTVFAWNPDPDDIFDTMGIFAPSPKQFRDSARVQTCKLPRLVPVSGLHSTYEITNRGLRISLPRIIANGAYVGLLNCRIDRNEYVGIHLGDIPRKDGSYQYKYGLVRLARVKGSRLQSVSRFDASDNYPYSTYIQAESRLAPMATENSITNTRIQLRGRLTSNWRIRDAITCSRDKDETHFLPQHLWAADNSRELCVFNSSNTHLCLVATQMKSFTIAVRNDQHRIRLGFASPAPESIIGPCTKATEQSHRDAVHTSSVHDQDYKVWALGLDTSVTLAAKKTRTKAGILWTVTIEVSNTTNNSCE